MKILWRISIKEKLEDGIFSIFSNKFGDDLETDEEIKDRMKEIKEIGIKLEGIHFHCGSDVSGSSNSLDRAIKLAKRCMVIGRSYGHIMEKLDIGGGFPAGDLTQTTIDTLQQTRNDPLGYQIVA